MCEANKTLLPNNLLGGDYRCLVMVLDMTGAISNHACIYCRVHSNDQGDVTKYEDLLR